MAGQEQQLWGVYWNFYHELLMKSRPQNCVETTLLSEPFKFFVVIKTM